MQLSNARGLHTLSPAFRALDEVLHCPSDAVCSFLNASRLCRPFHAIAQWLHPGKGWTIEQDYTRKNTSINQSEHDANLAIQNAAPSLGKQKVVPRGMMKGRTRCGSFRPLRRPYFG